MIKVGIDPGKKTGVALCVDGALKYLNTFDFWGVYFWIKNKWASHDGIEIHIEDTNDLPVFHKSGNKAVSGAIGMRVGSVCREASLLTEGFLRLGYTVICHQGKRSSKLDAKTFKQITGWKGRTNQHERDAWQIID